MGLTKFEITFDNPNQFYYAGQVISGKVIIGITRTRQIKGLTLSLSGYAKACWTIHQGKTSRRISETEKYIEDSINLIQLLGVHNFQNDVQTHLCIPEGETEYPFYYQLPPHIPSSFSSEHGFVKYYFEATIVNTTFKSNDHVKRHFTVNRILDLNLEHHASQAAMVNRDKDLVCCCIPYGRLSFHMELPKMGFAPGETLKFKATLSNSSGTNSTHATVSFMQLVKYNASRKKKQSLQQVAVVRGPVVESGVSTFWEGTMTIPSIPPTRLDGCSLIEIEYYLKFEMMLRIFGSRIIGNFPLIIGTIPVRNASLLTVVAAVPQRAFAEPRRIALAAAAWVTRPANSENSPIFNDYPDLALPTYEEALLMNEVQLGDDDDQSDGSLPPEYGTVFPDKKFVPKYPYYRS